MIYLVAAQTVVLALMAVLVAGLLRSHAEILRRLPDEDEDVRGPAAAPGAAGHEPQLAVHLANPPERGEGAFPAHDVAGETLAGDSAQVALTGGQPHTLLAFLSSGCLVCQDFWEALQPEARGPVPGDARVVVVTKDTAYESPSKLRRLAPSDVPVIMSSAAWEDYSVPVAPYFVYVGADGKVLGEGAASEWSQAMSLFEDALLDTDLSGETERREPERAARGRRRDRAAERFESEDDVLAAAGIGPGHPSLHPDGSGRAARGAP